MRYKVVPPVRSRAFLERVRGAVPLVPDDEPDCCRAIGRATGVDRETAREYLLFLRALGLVERSERGYYRTRSDPDRSELATAFRERVFGVEELLDAPERAVSGPDEAFAALRTEVPRWERERDPEWEGTWRERAGRLLGWAVELDVVERPDGEST